MLRRALVLLLCLLGALLVRTAEAQKSSTAAMDQITRLVGEAQEAEGKKDDATAEQRYREVLWITTAHPELGLGLQAVALLGLANIEDRRGNVAASVEFHRRRLDILRRMPGPVGMDVGDEMMNVGMGYEKLHQPDAAKEYFSSAIAWFEKCAAASNACRTRVWDVWAVWGGTLFVNGEDAAAEPILKKVLDAPQEVVRPGIRLTVLRAYAALLAREGRDKEAADMAQQAAGYAEEHPDAGSQIASWANAPKTSLSAKVPATQNRTVEKILEMDRAFQTATVPAQEDFSTYGTDASALEILHSWYYDTQESLRTERERLAGLNLGTVLNADALADENGVKEVRGRVEQAMLISERITVKGQSSISELEDKLRQRAAATTDSAERTSLERMLSAFVLTLGVYHKQIFELESMSHEMLKEIDAALGFLLDRTGRYTVQEHKLMFQNDSDRAAWSAAMQRIAQMRTELVQKQKDLMASVRTHQDEAARALGAPVSAPAKP